MSARHCLNDLPGCLFWAENRSPASHFDEAPLTDILNTISPLINVNLLSKLQSDQFFLDSIFSGVFAFARLAVQKYRDVGRLFHLSEMFLKSHIQPGS